MDLETFWFCLIVVVWAMYFLLEGFDFGVGMLLPFVPRSDEERSHALRTIGPVWDGNEVWLVVAGGATFAAFPAWYATMFSGFYLALLLILFFLIIRVVSFEWRAKSETPGWRAHVDVGEHDRELRRVAAVGDRAVVPALWRADRLGRRLHRRPPGSLQSVQRVRRHRGRCAVRVPRRDVPHAPHDGRSARPRRGRRPPACYSRRRARRRVPRLDGRGGHGPQRQGSLPAGTPGGPRHRCARAGCRVRPHWELRARVRDDRARCDLAGRDALREPVSARHGLEHRLREQPDGEWGRFVALRAPGDERRGVDLRSGVLLYQGWTYYVFRARVGSDGAATS